MKQKEHPITYEAVGDFLLWVLIIIIAGSAVIKWMEWGGVLVYPRERTESHQHVPWVAVEERNCGFECEAWGKIGSNQRSVGRKLICGRDYMEDHECAWSPIW